MKPLRLRGPPGPGFTRQPEKSKRAYLRVPALQTPKGGRKKENCGGRVKIFGPPTLRGPTLGGRAQKVPHAPPLVEEWLGQKTKTPVLAKLVKKRGPKSVWRKRRPQTARMLELGQFDSGQFDSDQFDSIRLRPIGPNRRFCVALCCVCVLLCVVVCGCVLVQDLGAPPDPAPPGMGSIDSGQTDAGHL